MTEFKPDTGIWRYMDVGRFLALIGEKKLYFARLHELEDPWEGVRSASDPIFSSDPEYLRLAASDFNCKPLVSCWHENEEESVAMWKLYVSGREGVAIKTTVSLFGQLLSGDREVKLGRVAYRAINDAEHWPEAFAFESGRCSGYKSVCNAERALFRKNKGYEHEREVRAVIYDYYSAEHAIADSTHPDHLANLSLGLRRSEGVGGRSMPVDISLLIKRIVVSPAFPAWAIRSLQHAVDAASIVVKVELSALLERPASETTANAR